MGTNTLASGSRSGFSLIELLVVVAIIAVLASMLLSGIKTVKAMAEKSRCSSNMRQIIQAWITNRDENSGTVLPAAGSWSYYSGWTNSPAAGRWFNNLEPYLETYLVFNCPTSARKQPQMAVANQTTKSAQGNWNYSRGSADNGGVCLYAYNYGDWGRTQDMGAKNGISYPISEPKLQRMVKASNQSFSAMRCPVFTDGIWAVDATSTGAYAYLVLNSWGCYYPHQGLTQNSAFMDGRIDSGTRTSFILSGVVQMAAK